MIRNLRRKKYGSLTGLSLEDIRRASSETRRISKLSHPFMIYLSGVDGAGKTTQLRLIDSALKAKGIRTQYVWLRWVAFVSFPFYAFCRLLGLTHWNVVDASGRRYAVHRFRGNKPLSLLWIWLYTIDMALYSLVKIRVPMMKGRIVLCDRFVVDAAADMMYETGYDLNRFLVLRILSRLIPGRSLTVRIDTNPTEAFGRKNDIPSEQYVVKLRGCYNRISAAFRMLTVQSATIEEINRRIVSSGLQSEVWWYLSK